MSNDKPLKNDNIEETRGGAWGYFPVNLRAALRFRTSTVFRFENLGFRMVNVPKKTQANDNED